MVANCVEIHWQENDFNILKEILNRSVSGDDHRLTSFFNKIHTVSRPHWNRMSEAEQRKLFETGSIHVVGSSEDQQLKTITSWSDPASFLPYLDLQTYRFVQGMIFYFLIIFVRFSTSTIQIEPNLILLMRTLVCSRPPLRLSSRRS
jgi:hypothetical protein